MQNELEQWVTTKEAAEILGLGDALVRYLCREGLVSAVKVNRDWLVNRLSVESYKKTGTGRPKKQVQTGGLTSAQNHATMK